MPTKTTKKVAAKKPVAKKAPVKKVAKPAVATKPVVAEIPLPDPYCHCTKRKRNCILTCVFTVAFLLGIVVSQYFFCHCPKHHAPRMHFVNGCVDVASVKCPKMLEQLPAIDADHDGCVTKSELRAAKKAMRHHKKAHIEEPAVVDAIAPVME